MATRKVSRSRISLTFDLNEMLIKAESDRKVRDALRPFIKRTEVKREFGQRVIDEILDRLDQGQGKDGSFRGRAGRYSKAYRESARFKFLKGGGSTVNLKLTGQMRSFIDIIETGDTTVTLGITDSEEATKAHGHIKGGGNLPVRDFWGLPEKLQYDIFKEIISDYEQTAMIQALQDRASTLLVLSPAIDDSISAIAATSEPIPDLTLTGEFFAGE